MRLSLKWLYILHIFILEEYTCIILLFPFGTVFYNNLNIYLLLIVGHDQHVGTKAPPPEIVLENAVMRTEPSIVRVQVVYLEEPWIDDDCY